MAARCLAASSRAADADGFVSVRNLLEQFEASIEFRPLLVEAMLCEKLDDPTTSHQARWHLLVDSEKHPIEFSEIDKESCIKPLSDRLRNTIAHELAHTLAFKKTDAGQELMLHAKRRQRPLRDEVAEIERRTEELSPLLLAADSSIAQAFPAEQKRLCVDDLARTRAKFGISRYVLVNRLNLLMRFGDRQIAFRQSLSNIGIGVGKWDKDGVPQLLGMPTYLNFDRVTPKFFSSASREKKLDFYSITSDPNFVLNGGSLLETSLLTRAGTPKNPESTQIQVDVAVEQHARKKKGTFFVLVSAKEG